MLEQERYLRRKYGNQLLINGLTNLIVGVAIFVISLNYFIADEGVLTGVVISAQILLTDETLAFISVYASEAYRKDTSSKKISDRSRNIIRGTVIAGSIAQALSGNVNTAIIASDALQNNDLCEIHFKPNSIIPVMESILSAFTMLFGLIIMTGSEDALTLSILIGAVVTIAQAIQIITDITGCIACKKWNETIKNKQESEVKQQEDQSV